MFRWLQSKMRQNEPDPETSGDAPDDREFGPVPWTVRLDSGLELHLTAGRDTGRSVPLDLAFAMLGRARSHRNVRSGWVDIVDATVSRRQAVLEWDPDARVFALHHVQGATNVTRVDSRAAPRLELRAGASISIGIVFADVRRRDDAAVLSTFVQDTLARLAARVTYDQFHSQDLALTVISDDGRGNTWLLNRGVHPLSATADGRLDDMLGLNAPHEEVGLLFWSDDAGYRLVGNAATPGVLRLYKGENDAQRADRIFGAPRSAPIEVDDGQAHVLHVGDVLEIGSHRLRLHGYGRVLVSACARHALSGKMPEEMPPPDEMLSGVPSQGDEREGPAPPQAQGASDPTGRPFQPFGGQPAAASGGFGAAPPRVPGGFGAAPPPVPGGFGAAPPPVPGGFGAAPPPVPGGFGAAPPPRSTRTRREGDEPLQAGDPPGPSRQGRTPRPSRPNSASRDDSQDAEASSQP